MDIERLYLDFRQELDKICVPEILKCVYTKEIKWGGLDAGILCYADMDWIYIDCMYIKPEYRRCGLASGAALDFYEEHKNRDIRLGIINKNHVAYQFWTSIFDLEELEGNSIDTLYRIKGVRV